MSGGNKGRRGGIKHYMQAPCICDGIPRGRLQPRRLARALADATPAGHKPPSLPYYNPLHPCESRPTCRSANSLALTTVALQSVFLDFATSYQYPLNLYASQTLFNAAFCVQQLGIRILSPSLKHVRINLPKNPFVSADSFPLD
ncbi:hypothetical protein GQ44DRAFT_729373 [Phaeosphaeriaceae sp. PMI808]|nr:hypothetical protein GQ44DRAFT_729373 [Phaeosphaeriaceae sp. PMI808]